MGARGGRDYYMPDLPDGGSCDPNARLVSMYNCANGSGAIFGCLTVDGGQVPQVSQILSPGTSIAGTQPPIPVYYEIITVNPQNPNQIGNADFPTVPGVFNCGYDCPPAVGGACVWAGGGPGQYPNWQACDNAITAGICNPEPRYYCIDYNCGELYNSVMGWGTSSNPTASQVTAQLLPGPGNNYRQVFTTIDDCIACCGGVNIPTYLSGTINPYYGMTTQPTPHLGFQAYLAGANPTTLPIPQNSGSFINYMWTQGIDSCGEVYCTPWPQCS